MNATSRTLVFVAVAAAASVTAMGVRYANRPAAVEGFSDVGQEFYTDFQDPLKATELSVLKFDSDAKDPLSFLVRQNDKGLWVIPSHHDYPAEAAERLAKTATSLIGIRKIALQSRSKDDWARYGVEDPSAEVAVDATAKESGKDSSRGTRITLRDSSGNSLVDLIVGKPVEGREKHFYVRQPEKNPVFIAKLDADLSAKFSDWIEPDLLKLTQNDIVKVIVDQYSVDEEQGAILQGEKLELNKDKTTSKWAIADLDPVTESLRESAITDVTSNLDQLKIVGVRPKPEGLNPDLTVSREVAQNPLLRQILQADMQRQGFYIARGEGDQVKLVSNEGELIAGTNNGVRYTLYFGEIARGTAKDIETGLNEAKPAEGEAKAADADSEAKPADEETKTGESPPETPAAEEKPDGPESGPRRYLLVKVEYDESLLGPPPTEPVAPEKPAILNEGAAPTTENPGDAPKEDAPKEDAPKEDAPKEDAPKEDAPKEDAPKEDAPKEDAPKEDAPKEDAPKEDSPKEDAEKSTEPSADTPVPETTTDPKSESPADPGSCDEPPAAEPAQAEPPKESPAQETPAPAATPAAQETPVPATADETTPAKDDAAAPAKSDEPATPQVDPNAPPSTPTPQPQPPADPKAEAQKAYDQAMGDYEAAKAGHQSALKSWEVKTKEGKKKVDELSTRFGSWYYVISADSFEKLKLSRASVVEPKKAEPNTDDSPIPGADSVPNFDLPGPGK